MINCVIDYEKENTPPPCVEAGCCTASGLLQTYIKENVMPPSGFSKAVVAGAIQFVGGCYRDLLQEVQDGKHESFETAIKYELSQIEKALQSIHIDDQGSLVNKETKDPLIFK